jgi:hypothetical protein
VLPGSPLSPTSPRSGARTGAPRPFFAKDRAAALGKRRIAIRQKLLSLFNIDIAVGVYANACSMSRANNAKQREIVKPRLKYSRKLQFSGFSPCQKILKVLKQRKALTAFVNRIILTAISALCDLQLWLLAE